MEHEPQHQHPHWEMAKTLGAMAGSSVLLVGGSLAATKFFERGTPEGTLGGTIMLVLAVSGLLGILEGHRQL